MSHTEVEEPSEAKWTAHTSTLEAPTKKSLRRPSVPASVPHLSYLNEAVRDSVRERWNGEALEIEEPSATRRKEFTDYPEGGYGWVIVASKSATEFIQYIRISITLYPCRQVHSCCASFTWASSMRGALCRMRCTSKDSPNP